jgi:sugar phosphate isomerase/epimerase
MKLAISNIAWDVHDDPEILHSLKENGISGIEVAPTKLWENWQGTSHKEAKEYRKFMLNKGFELPAMQAILFGKPELQVFDKSTHFKFLEHIKIVADLANGFGAKVLVFGAPNNRKRGQIPFHDAYGFAVDFFYKLAEICYAQECCIGLEHNPIEYGCDFITNAFDARDLVDSVHHDGFKLHVDSAGLHMCGGNIAEHISSLGAFDHYHISEPMLAPIYKGVVDHKSALNALRLCDYDKWVSIEMKQPHDHDSLIKSVKKISNYLL